MKNWQVNLAESVTMFLLILVGCGVVCLNIATHGQVGAASISGSAGVVVAFAVYGFAYFSSRYALPGLGRGANDGPRFPVRRLVRLVGFQTIGAWLACTLLAQLFPVVARAGLKLPAASWTGAFVIEVAVVAVVMLIIMGTAPNNRALVQVEALTISCMVAGIAVVAGPKDGGWLNPARPLGPALASGTAHSLWIFALGPVVGAVIGAVAYKTVRYVQTRPVKPPKPKPVPPPSPPPPPPPPEPLAAPAQLTGQSPTNLAAISWEPVAQADHYAVFRDNSQIATQTPTTFSDAGITDGPHVYAVAAVDAQGTEGVVSSDLTITVDTVGPHIDAFGPFSKIEQMPLALAIPAYDDMGHVVGGEYFIGATDPGLGAGTPLELSDGLLVTGNADTTLADLAVGTYPLTVRARDGAGNWTDPAAVTQLIVQEAPTTHADLPLTAPADVMAKSPTRSAPQLQWSEVPGATSYQIWKRNSHTRSTTQVGTTTAPAFTDEYEPGANSYVVLAVNSTGQSGPSAPVVVEVVDNSSMAVQEFMAQTRPEVVPKVGETK